VSRRRGGSGDRPRYGDRDNQRSDNARSGDRPRYNKDRDNQRSSGGYKSDRTGSGDRPRYNNDRAGSGDRPRYNSDRGGSSDRPRFNSDRGGDRPRYNDRSDRVNDRDRDDLRDGSSSRPQRPAKFQDRKKDWTKSDGNTGDRPKRFDGDRKPRTAGRPQRSTDQSTSGQREQRHERPRNFDERLNSMENVYLYDIDDLQADVERENRIQLALLRGVVDAVKGNRLVVPVFSLAICAMFPQWVGLDRLAGWYLQVLVALIHQLVIFARYGKASRFRR